MLSHGRRREIEHHFRHAVAIDLVFLFAAAQRQVQDGNVGAVALQRRDQRRVALFVRALGEVFATRGVTHATDLRAWLVLERAR